MKEHSNIKRRLNILITAGATREPVDPVRFISNYATGYLGCTIAREAKKRGHNVFLICGALGVSSPKSISGIEIVTARDLDRELRTRFDWCDCLVMTAAVCDFRAKHVGKKKIKRGQKKEMNIALVQNPDILMGLSRKKGKKVLVGFSLETDNVEFNACNKLKTKKLDLIVATRMDVLSPPFGQAKADVLILDKNGGISCLGKVGKPALARILLKRIETC